MELESEIQPTFLRGANSGLSPGLIGRDQVWWARDCSTRGGRLRTRARWVRRKTLYTGNPQGGVLFGVTGEIMLSLGGHIIAVNPRDWEMRVFTDNSDRNSSLNAFAYWCETEGSVILQDGHSYPWVYDGGSARRFTQAAGDTLPIGTVMAYGNGRLTVAVGNARNARIGNIRQAAHQSELEFTETGRLVGGGDLSYPRPIKALAYTSVVDTSSGQGPLIVGLRGRTYTVHTNNPSRDTWASTQDFETQLFPTHGITGPYAFAQVNQDLYFRAVDGLRSARLTISDLAGPGATPLSREVDYRFATDTQWMLDGCSIAAFDNRLFCTHSPSMLILDNSRIVHTGVVALNFDLLSSMGQKSPAAYDGEWVGPPIVQLIAGEVDEQRRLLALCREGDANTLWEFLPERLMRTDVSQGIFAQDNPRGYVETRVHYGRDPRFLRKLSHLKFKFRDVHGFCRFDVSFRAEGALQWTALHTFKFQKDTATFLDPSEDEVRELATNYAPETRDDKPQRIVNVARGFQFKFEWCGDLSFEYEVITSDAGRPISDQNQTESVDLTAVECPDRLPAEPVSPEIGPALSVLLQEYEEITLVGDALACGNIPSGGTLAVSLLLRNDGGTNLTIAAITLTGDQYEITSDPTGEVIAPGDSVELALQVNSYEAVDFIGQLTIESDDEDSPREIALSALIGNEEQTCEEGYVGTPVPADTVFAATPGAANDAAAEGLSCELDVFPAQAAGTSKWVFALAQQDDGKILVGGSFDTLCGEAQPFLGRINRNGSRDTSFNPVLNGTVFAIRILVDGKILIVGTFTSVNGNASAVRIAILEADGTLDTSFLVQLSSSISQNFGDVIELNNGDILVGTDGAVATVNGVAWANHFVRLTRAGVHDTAFNPSVGASSNFVYSLLALPNDNILVGGAFINLAGVAAFDRIGVVDDDGVAVGGFTCTVPNTQSVDRMLLLSDGSVLLGGTFETINGAACEGAARINPATGALVSGWTNPDIDQGSPGVRYLSEQEDGKYIISGDLTQAGGTTWGFIARLNADGSRDTSWPVPGVRNGDLWVTIVLADGAILVGFVSGTTIYAESRDGLALVSSAGVLVPLS